MIYDLTIKEFNLYMLCLSQTYHIIVTRRCLQMQRIMSNAFHFYDRCNKILQKYEIQAGDRDGIMTVKLVEWVTLREVYQFSDRTLAYGMRGLGFKYGYEIYIFVSKILCKIPTTMNKEIKNVQTINIYWVLK